LRAIQGNQILLIEHLKSAQGAGRLQPTFRTLNSHQVTFLNLGAE